MSKLEPTVGPYDVTPLKRVSWGAIFGGTFISLAIMVLLGSLGIAIGATTIDPATGETPSARAFGIGAGIWWIASSMLALFGGGWAAGRLAGPRRPLESTLHGLVTWSFTTTIAVALMTTAVGSMVSGAMRVLGTTASSIVVQAAAGGAGAQDDVSDVNRRHAGAAPDRAHAPDPDMIWQEVWTEAQRVVRENRRQLQQQMAPQDVDTPDTGDVAADDVGQQRQQGAVWGQPGAGQGAIMDDPQVALDALEARLSRMFRNARERVSQADKDELVDTLVARTELSRDEARDIVNRWSSRFQGAWPQQSQQPAIRQPAAGTPGAGMDTAQAAETAARAVASAAWWTFFYFIFTAVAGGVGGMLGSMRRRREGGVDYRETRSVTP